MKAAEEDDKIAVDICYEGDWTVAQDRFTDCLAFSILNVYPSGALEVEVYNVVDDKESFGIIDFCHWFGGTFKTAQMLEFSFFKITVGSFDNS